MMIGGHLGPRVSALLDGQLSATEAERAWVHVHQCHACRDQVEREGWVKTRLAGLSGTGPVGLAPADLKGSLLGMPPHGVWAYDSAPPRRPSTGVMLLSGSALGAAVLGVLAFGTAPAEAPSLEQNPPVTVSVPTPPAPAQLPVRHSTR